jgi:hypothetical protein
MVFGAIRQSTLALGLLSFTAAAALAQTYNVALDTTGLNTGDSYALDLQLNQGAATTPTSTVNVSGFTFGGGSPGPISTVEYSGSASGDLSSSVSLSTADPFNEFTENFNNGTSIGFNVDGTQLMTETGGTPDQFIFDLIDNSTNMSVTTNDVSGEDSLFTLTCGTDGTYTAQDFGYMSSGGSTFTTTSILVPTPEQGTATNVALLGCLTGLGVLRARRSGRAVADETGNLNPNGVT